jgi:hypothetical protein
VKRAPACPLVPRTAVVEECGRFRRFFEEMWITRGLGCVAAYNLRFAV